MMMTVKHCYETHKWYCFVLHRFQALDESNFSLTIPSELIELEYQQNFNLKSKYDRMKLPFHISIILIQEVEKNIYLDRSRA